MLFGHFIEIFVKIKKEVLFAVLIAESSSFYIGSDAYLIPIAFLTTFSNYKNDYKRLLIHLSLKFLHLNEICAM